MSELPTRAEYVECQGDPFQIIPESANPVAVELIEVTSLARNAAPAPDRPFSLIFRGLRTPVLPQRMYLVEHERLGGHLLFLVPIGPDEHGMRYQAIFN